MLGKSETAVITFDGPIVPRFIYYYGGEMPCVPYRTTRQYCKLCKSQGHRTNVCPTPTAKAYSNCRLRDPPEDHTCEPVCPVRRGSSHGGIGMHQESQMGPPKGQATTVTTSKLTTNQRDPQETLVQQELRGLYIARRDPFQVHLPRPLQLQEQ
ncbi:hypothetical protein HPB49_004948 [Dermacentor silvarum]|uniref:Uncharacterized protein n=1 Tax=Dermacentor silvarum TaxID=543639 RepID=A0ACB8DVA8_DERSI|nr:hypothetical protein HPB49_004948 [Dermacentor silvarum]